MDWPTAAVIIGATGTISAAIARFIPKSKSNNGGNGRCDNQYGSQITILVTKFESFEKKMDSFMAENTRINDEQYNKINATATKMAAVETTLEILKKKVLNGGG